MAFRFFSFLVTFVALTVSVKAQTQSTLYMNELSALRTDYYSSFQPASINDFDDYATYTFGEALGIESKSDWASQPTRYIKLSYQCFIVSDIDTLEKAGAHRIIDKFKKLNNLHNGIGTSETFVALVPKKVSDQKLSDGLSDNGVEKKIVVIGGGVGAFLPKNTGLFKNQFESDRLVFVNPPNDIGVFSDAGDNVYVNFKKSSTYAFGNIVFQALKITKDKFVFELGYGYCKQKPVEQ